MVANPHEVNAASLQAAHERWDAFRAEIWQVTAEARGERSRSAVLKRLRPGSRSFRLVTSVVGSVLRSLKRLGLRSASIVPTSAENFPDHFSTNGVIEVAEQAAVPLVLELPASGEREAWSALEAELARGETHAVLVLPGVSLLPGAASRLLDVAKATNADLTFGDHLQRSDEGLFGVTTLLRRFSTLVGACIELLGTWPSLLREPQPSSPSTLHGRRGRLVTVG